MECNCDNVKIGMGLASVFMIILSLLIGFYFGQVSGMEKCEDEVTQWKVATAEWARLALQCNCTGEEEF